MCTNISEKTVAFHHKTPNKLKGWVEKDHLPVPPRCVRTPQCMWGKYISASYISEFSKTTTINWAPAAWRALLHHWLRLMQYSQRGNLRESISESERKTPAGKGVCVLGGLHVSEVYSQRRGWWNLRITAPSTRVSPFPHNQSRNTVGKSELPRMGRKTCWWSCSKKCPGFYSTFPISNKLTNKSLDNWTHICLSLVFFVLRLNA